MPITFAVRILICAVLWICLYQPYADAAEGTSFAEFDRRAKAGERLNVVFFGASLTWGANATDPLLTSYRARIADRLEKAYPQARIKCWDAAIGGTGSQLGLFRLQRDVLRRKPDLVFLDFSANDDIYSDGRESLASYEAIVRRLILEAKCPVVQVIFPFKWNVAMGTLDDMKRRTAHRRIGAAYHTAVGDAIELARRQVESGAMKIDAIWPFDGAHPGDAGYELFADSAWSAFQGAIKSGLKCECPKQMLYGPTYMHSARVRMSSLAPLPAGWRAGAPNLVAAYFDMLMSRWLDDEVIASTPPAKAEEPADASRQPERFKVNFRGEMLLLFGESTPKSGSYRAYIDGQLVERTIDKKAVSQFDTGELGRKLNGGTHYVQVLAEGLDPKMRHTLEIEPIFKTPEEELRLESICVAGSQAASVSRD